VTRRPGRHPCGSELMGCICIHYIQCSRHCLALVVAHTVAQTRLDFLSVTGPDPSRPNGRRRSRTESEEPLRARPVRLPIQKSNARHMRPG
jgi:hypothetical protein